MAKARITGFDRVMEKGSGTKWLNWVNDPGTANVQDAFDGGEPVSTPYAIVDLSALASDVLGRQMSQSATYRLRGLTVGFRNHDDTPAGVQNESESAFQGQFEWFSDTEHGRKALSLARQTEREMESDEIDSDSFLLSDEKDYSAVRFGWSANDDVWYQTNYSGGTQWTLMQVRNVYNAMTAPDENNALFVGRFPNRQRLGWNTQVASGAYADGMGGDNGETSLGGGYDHNQTGLYHEVLAGLMACFITHSSISDPQGTIEDEYEWYIGVDLEVTY